MTRETSSMRRELNQTNRFKFKIIKRFKQNAKLIQPRGNYKTEQDNNFTDLS